MLSIHPDVIAIYGSRAESMRANVPYIVDADLKKIEKIPDGFIPVTQRFPENDLPVIILRSSTYSHSENEILTARYMAKRFPDHPWRLPSDESLRKRGGEFVLAWRPMIEWIGEPDMAYMQWLEC